MNKKSNGWIDKFAVFTFLVLLDFIAKKFAMDRCLSENVIFSSKLISIVENFTLNYGISFGLLASVGHYIKYIILLMLCYILYHVFYTRALWLLMVFSGGVGNLIDRFLYDDCVIDFLEIKILDYSVFVCNFADIYINIGFWIFIIQKYILKSSKNSDCSMLKK